MTKWGAFPLGVGNRLEFIIHDPISVGDRSFEEVFERTEQAVVQSIMNTHTPDGNVLVENVFVSKNILSFYILLLIRVLLQ